MSFTPLRKFSKEPGKYSESLHMLVAFDGRVEKLFSIPEQQNLHVLALAHENVEREENDVSSRGCVLESIEAESALVVEGDQFTIKSGSNVNRLQ
jgi:hypothetical protein